MKEIKTDEEFSFKLKEELFIFIGKSRDCVVCNPMQVKLENLLNEYDLNGYYGYMENLALTRGKNTIFSAPIIIIFYNGKEIIREAGFINFNRIIRTLEHIKTM